MNHDFRPVRIFVLSATSFVFTAVVTLLAVIALATCAGNPTTASASRLAGKKPANPTMRAFASEDEMKAYFRKLAEEQKRVARRSEVMASPAESVAINQAAAPAAKAGADKDEAESITNTQHAGVDEGGIVKLHGDHLVVLRRGRLFTVAIGNGALKPLSIVNAYGPEIDPRYTWYDEMLVSDDTVVVIGYSYERGGTEVGLFNIDASGNLSYRSTYHLRSNDYYSS